MAESEDSRLSVQRITINHKSVSHTYNLAKCSNRKSKTKRKFLSSKYFSYALTTFPSLAMAKKFNENAKRLFLVSFYLICYLFKRELCTGDI